MALEKFELKSLSVLDGGRIREAFEQALKRCESDCKDRPALAEARKVTLSAEMIPVSAPNGELESVDVRFSIKDSIPTRKSNLYNMKAARGGLVWNEMSPDDVNQLTLDDVGPHGEVERAG